MKPTQHFWSREIKGKAHSNKEEDYSEHSNGYHQHLGTFFLENSTFANDGYTFFLFPCLGAFRVVAFCACHQIKHLFPKLISDLFSVCWLKIDVKLNRFHLFLGGFGVILISIHCIIHFVISVIGLKLKLFHLV